MRVWAYVNEQGRLCCALLKDGKLTKFEIKEEGFRLEGS